ncbi:unnamed protein product [Lactuca virosa]|uniref:Endonuclease/exonuclease/phosphatase domain-containing protein n=1 Tax=Lactuca virosa TaxID=75947 RepID=A0AAU9M4K0_9ASTR|nr:unnamed protein product [Lactuca virosa]
MVWNVRGLCNSSTQKEVVSMLDRNGVSLCALLETRMHISRINKVCKGIKGNWQCYSNASLCNRGTRIAIGWDPGAWDVFVINSFDQVVHCRVHSKNSNHTFFMSFVYADNDYRDRRKLWDYLWIHHSLVKDEPWLIAGDFNQVLKPSESTRSSSFDSFMTDFQRCIDDTNLGDINATGLYYTWNQKPRGIGGLLRKLDRTMGNTNILSMFPKLHVMYKPYGISDHSPALISFPIGKPKKYYDFKFVNNFTNHPQFHDTVQSIWGNRVEALRVELERAEEQLDRDPDNEEVSVEHAKYLEEFTKALCEEECLLRQKTKLNWLKEGDRNTKYYHKVIKERQSRNKINSITGSNGVMHGANQVADIAIAHFSDFLGKDRDVDPIISLTAFSAIL